MNFNFKESYYGLSDNVKILGYWLAGILMTTALIAFFDQGLAAGLALVEVLTIIIFAILFKYKAGDKKIYILFLITLLMHIAAVLFIYYTGFRPAGGGADFEGYHQNAVQVAERFSHGNFSLEGLYTFHYFPVLIGIVYMVSLPKMIVGQLFVAWLAALAVLFLYYIIVEVGGSRASAFIIGFMVNGYASYLYYGSLLLKDTVVIPLALLGLLIIIKIVKRFSWLSFLLFFATVTALIHFRFYIGFALLFSFIFSWFVLSAFNVKKRMIYGIFMIFVLGFSPVLIGYGYYGVLPLKVYINKEVITKYREVVYAPDASPKAPIKEQLTVPASNAPSISEAKPTTIITPPEVKKPEPPATPVEEKNSSGSSFIINPGFDNPFTFVRNYFLAFIYSLLGPFPWQLRFKRHLFFLLETIPWYLFVSYAIYIAYKYLRQHGITSCLIRYKFTLPVLLFSAMSLGALSLYISNFGIISRIRMPVFISLLCLASFGVHSNSLEKIYEKIFSYGRRWFYRV